MNRLWRVAAAGAIWALAAAPSLAETRPAVVVTIDVESTVGVDLPRQVDAVCTGGRRCGLAEIARTLESRRLAGTFFLNVYEHPRWGEAAMRDVAVRLRDSGQDVELHTHPETAFDPRRSEMYDYTLDEQTAILKEGVRLLGTWTGQRVVAHRAGDYSANDVTLQALERSGIPIDSSLFWGHRSSRLSGIGLPRNIPARRGGVLEIPVTSYERADRPWLLSSVLKPVTVVRKIDIDWLVDEREMTGAIDAAAASDFPVIVVFLHSFSFMGPSSADSVQPNEHAMKMFSAMLDYIASRNLPVVTMRDIAERGLGPLPSADRDRVPRVTQSVDPVRYAWRRMRGGSRAALIGALLTAALAAAALLVLVRRSIRKGWLGGAARVQAPSGVQAR